MIHYGKLSCYVLCFSRHHKFIDPRSQVNSELIFHTTSDNMMLRKFVRLGKNAVSKRIISAWATFAKKRTNRHIDLLRMTYWKGERALEIWRAETIWRNKVKKTEDSISKMQKKIILRKYLELWYKFFQTQRKINRACTNYKPDLKYFAFGLGMLTHSLRKLSKKSIFYLWYDMTMEKGRFQLAFNLGIRINMRFRLITWREFARKEKKKRKKEIEAMHHQKTVFNTLQHLEFELDKTYKDHEVRSKVVSKESADNMNKERYKALQRRVHYNAHIDKIIMTAQSQSRRMRVRTQMKHDHYAHEKKWEHKEFLCMKECREKIELWLNTSEAQNFILKQLKEFKHKDHISSITFTNATDIALSILDGKMGYAGILLESFSKDLENRCKGGHVPRSEMANYLSDVGINMSSSQIRDIFELDRTNTGTLSLIVLKEAMQLTYIVNGCEGCRWKKYVSPAHQKIIYHDVVGDQVRYLPS